MPNKRPNLARDIEMFREYLDGCELKVIANKHGISVTRATECLKKLHREMRYRHPVSDEPDHIPYIAYSLSSLLPFAAIWKNRLSMLWKEKTNEH